MTTPRPDTPAWLILITNLPGPNQTLRMRIWRALKSAGAGLLKDGVYLLPSSPAARTLFDDQVRDITAGGGNGFVVAADAQSSEQSQAFAALFDRSAEYADFLKRLETLQRQFKQLAESEARQKLTAFRRELVSLIARDFFAGESRSQAEAALTDAEAALNRRYSPDEPHDDPGAITRKDAAKYRARTWATRQRMWIDRVASAWLIRRFVDPKAKFRWLKHIQDCPKQAVGFDFEGAEFTHRGSKVTFEVIVATFGLESDMALLRLGTLVHYLDVGGVPVAEAAGFASIMAGARALQPDDDALLEAMTPVFDSLYAAYSQPELRQGAS
jgi:hypothetical protein